jgi:hypothetical protein
VVLAGTAVVVGRGAMVVVVVGAAVVVGAMVALPEVPELALWDSHSDSE